MMEAKKMIQQEGWVILASAVDIKRKEKTLDAVPIVSEFLEVF